MKVLLDTHVFYWWMTSPAKLSRHAFEELTNIRNTVLVSAAVGLELAIKANIGKVDALPMVLHLSRYTGEKGFHEATIDVEHGARAGLLPLHHRDPFDRILIAQAEAFHAPIISADPLLDLYDVKRLW